MIVRSEERSTGMGATHYSAVLVGNEFIRVSDLDNAKYFGRNHGVYEYEIEIADNAIYAEFYRSNSGKESVTIYRGDNAIKKFQSFDAVDAWAIEQGTMRKYYILNSAVITGFGTFKYYRVDVEGADMWLESREWTSTIGYQETCDVFNEMFSTSIEPNREMVKLEVGDEALVFRLTKRLDDIGQKGNVSQDEIRKHLEIGLLKRLA